MKDLSVIDGAIQRPCSAEPFEADRIDRFFAVLAFIIGYIYIRWVIFSGQGWGVAAFTAGFCIFVTLYLIKKGINIPTTAYFFLGAVLLTGISYALYSGNGLRPWRGLFLHCAAVYYVLSASGRLVLGDTSNWILLDGINGFLIIPFRNFSCQYKSIFSRKYMEKSRERKALSIALGVLLALLASGIVLPLLMKADSGGFYRIAKGIIEYFRWIQDQLAEIVINSVLAIPVAAYLFGLGAGSVHGRGCSTFKKDNVEHWVKSMGILAPATIYTSLGLICCLYLVFIGSQLPYFFSAFFGRRPEGWQIYSEYARSGFFELCQIAAFNMFLLIMANFLHKGSEGKNHVIKILNALLSLLTLLLIATAFSKMALYIGAYGLSIRRLLPCLFMIFLAVIFAAIIVLQKRRFSIVRFSVLIGTLMFCAICLLDPDGFAARYNADRYLSGTLEKFDVQILYQSGPAGINPALRVYGETDDKLLKGELEEYINNQQHASMGVRGSSRDNLQHMLVRCRL